MNIKLRCAYLMPLLLFSFTGCVKRSNYTSYELQPLTQISADIEETQSGVTIRAKCYTQRERNRLFNKRGRYLKSIQPLQLTCINNSDVSWFLRPEGLSVPLIDAGKITKILTFWSGWRTFGILVGGLITGTVLAATGYGLLAWCGGVGGSLATAGLGYLACAGAGYFYIMAPVSTYTTAKTDAVANYTIQQNVTSLTFLEQLEIPARTTVDTLIFVDALDWQGRCTLTITNSMHDTLAYTLVFP